MNNLPQNEQEFLNAQFARYPFSHQQRHQLIDIATDLYMWQEGTLRDIWQEIAPITKQNLKIALARLHDKREHLRHKEKSYEDFTHEKSTHHFRITQKSKESLGFGLCPVASPATRCCNLLTLDSVESCGFDCSYCSIQSFYNNGEIVFDSDLQSKIDALTLNPNEMYHIGTGQSSDSLMWGNRFNTLGILNEFAHQNPNVILEFKTKSKNIDFFLQHDIAKNIIITWSLNPQTIITHEERLSASLKERLAAAKALHDRGILVGFHFHPMVHYRDYQAQYQAIFEHLIANFEPERVAMVSFGTLTFIKPVIKALKTRTLKSKILQMPLTQSNKKLSYPLALKEQMFKFAYDLLKPWHNRVYFYMCMEDKRLWQSVFGYEYPTNESFEMDMKLHYMKKIETLRKVQPQT